MRLLGRLFPGNSDARPWSSGEAAGRGWFQVSAREGGSQEAAPLGGGKGEMPGAGVLGVADGRAAGEVGYLDAVLPGAAVSALPEALGDVGHFYTVLTCTAVAALSEPQSCHDSPSSDVIMSWRKSMDWAAVKAALCTSRHIAS